MIYAMKRLFAWMLLLALIAPLRVLAEPADDQYVRIYNVIQEGDVLSGRNEFGKALAKYQEAQLSLERFKRIYPDWNNKVVNFRLTYLSGKITTIAAKEPAAPVAPTKGRHRNKRDRPCRNPRHPKPSTAR